ncbi:MAG: hypothetical protein FJ026_11605, partial [Chloroflexi bacterium]|nr:hypothetical protein [Chloroflexota bacterium]
MCKGRRRKHRDAPYVSSTWYNALGLPTQMALSDTIVTRWGYFGLGGEWDSHPALGWDNFGRLESLRTSAPSLAPLLDLRYDYDAAGNVTRWANFRYQVGNWPAASSIADSFDVSSTVTFTYSSRQTVPYNDGGQNVCQSSGTGVDLSAQFYRTAYSLNTGDALRLRFKVDQDDTATRLAIETSPSGTYRRLGVVAYGGKLYVQTVEGSTTRYPADLLLDLQTNTWYTLSIVLDDQAGFYLEACQESDPSVRGSYHTPMPAGQSWRFHHWIQNGNCYLDDYREYTDTSGLDWSPKEWLALGYDSLHRLTGTGALSPWQGYTATYAYNPIGNLTESNESGVSWSYTYPDSGLGSVRPHAASSLSNGYTYQYDGNGNLVTRTLGSDTYALQYDLEGRVVEVKKNTV